MWLITNFGFFSVVQKPGDDLLTVRSRVKADLEELQNRYIPNLSEILETADSDYCYRSRVSKVEFGDSLKKIAMDIDYDNFKNSVYKKQGHKRAGIYGRIWELLLNLKKVEV